MLATSCVFNGKQYFFCKIKQRPQTHMTWAYMDNVSKTSADVLAITSALICGLLINGMDIKDLEHIYIYDAHNKNISKTLKTDEIEHYKQFFPIYEKIKKYFETNSELKEHLFENDWGGLQGLSGFCKAILTVSPNRFAIAPIQHKSQIIKAISQFNKDFSGCVYEAAGTCVIPLTDKLYINIKIALSADVYETIQIFEFDLDNA